MPPVITIPASILSEAHPYQCVKGDDATGDIRELEAHGLCHLEPSQEEDDDGENTNADADLVAPPTLSLHQQLPPTYCSTPRSPPPMMPCGRKSKIRIRTTKAKMSLKPALVPPAATFSSTPSRIPPTTAPGELTIPPMMAAMKPFSPSLR